MAPKSHFNFRLEQPIKYHKSGEVVETFELVLRAPSKKTRKPAIKLKKGFFSALNYHQQNSDVTEEQKAAAKKSLKEDDNMSGQEVMMMLYMSDVDMEKIDDAFTSLLLSPGICKIDDEIDLTDAILDTMSDEDLDRLLGDYLANFFIGSIMQKMNE